MCVISKIITPSVPPTRIATRLNRGSRKKVVVDNAEDGEASTPSVGIARILVRKRDCEFDNRCSGRVWYFRSG